MAIASMVCGIVGFVGLIISGIRLVYLNQIKEKVGLVFQWQIQSQITTAIIFVVISFILMILAFIFGIIERKKGKSYKYYGMATAGFVLGLIGILLPILHIIFVTGTVITYNIMNKGGKQQTVINDPSSPYLGTRPVYSYFSNMGTITTKTKDSYSVTVDIILGYDLNDDKATEELNTKKDELINYFQRYFNGKTSAELVPEKEEELKRDIREQLNTRILDTARIRLILFNKLDVMEVN